MGPSMWRENRMDPTFEHASLYWSTSSMMATGPLPVPAIERCCIIWKVAPPGFIPDCAGESPSGLRAPLPPAKASSTSNSLASHETCRPPGKTRVLGLPKGSGPISHPPKSRGFITCEASFVQSRMCKSACRMSVCTSSRFGGAHRSGTGLDSTCGCCIRLHRLQRGGLQGGAAARGPHH